MMDCPICKLIEEGEVTAQGELCCVVKWGKRKIAVLKDHSENADAACITEAMELLNFGNGEGMLSDFNDAAGHWGMHFTQSEIFQTGRSDMRN